MSKTDELFEGFKPLIELCIDAGIAAERERVRKIIDNKIEELEDLQQENRMSYMYKNEIEMLQKLL